MTLSASRPVSKSASGATAGSASGSTLFSKFKLRELEFRNRVFVSPMCQYSSSEGFATDWHLVHLGTRAVGGAGLVMTEAAAVSPQGRITPFDLGVWLDAHVEKLSSIAHFIQNQGAVPAIQIAHAGRKASCEAPWRGGGPLSLKPEANRYAWTTLGPSAIAFDEKYPAPLAMTEAQIEAVVTDFMTAIERSRKAGFQVIELHMAHGYLLHEFLSPLSNQRTDQYGGSLVNRMRLPLRIAAEARRYWPAEWPVMVRISASDWVDGGWDLASSIEFCNELKKVGIDLIDCSSGGNAAHARIPLAPGYQVPFASTIRKEVDIATGAVGLITEAQQAETIVRSQQADVVFLARELLRNPYWPLAAAQELGADIHWPDQYARARPHA
jgi:2,4-dienoyl-CoA reductase-like NADH-dependent reductase (Old Yellow Enzyme family)